MTVDEPDNLILQLLREIGAKQDEHSRKLAQHDERFDTLDRNMTELRESVMYAVGFATHANIQHQTVSGKLRELEARIVRLEERDRPPPS